MTKRRRLIAMIICAIMALSMVVSSAYFAYEAARPHRCPGENCPVCRFIAQIGRLRRDLALILRTFSLICLALLMCHGQAARPAACLPALFTPVGRKIRLNN